MSNDIINFHIAVYDDLDVINLSSVNSTKCRKVIYFIKCTLSSTSMTGKNEYFTHHLYDENFNRIENNTFNYYGIECIIHEKEFWGGVAWNWSGVVLKATIRDKEGSVVDWKLSNWKHDADVYRILFDQIKLLNQYNTHEELNKILKANKIT
jgi:hypothetical protein